jgi:hypothetical protein
MHKKNFIGNIEIAEEYSQRATLYRTESETSVISDEDQLAALKTDQDGKNDRVEDVVFKRNVLRSSITYGTGSIRERKSFRKQNKRADFAYDMSHSERGFHLIFAQENFDENSGLQNLDNPNDDVKREGTEADVESLKRAYKHLGFKNRVFYDKSVEEIGQILSDFSRMDHTSRDCIAVTMLTHGNMDELFARDGSFPADEIWQPFQANNCTSLAGKPKLFICQACKGTKKNPGAESIPLKSDGSNVRIATQSDFIWGFSTCRGDVSYRHCKEGSIYIQALCKVILSDSRRTMDIVSILTMANRETNRKFNVEGYEEYMQCSNFTTSLRGKVKFPKKNKFATISKALATPLPQDESDEEISQKLASTSLSASQVPSSTTGGQSVLAAHNSWV